MNGLFLRVIVRIWWKKWTFVSNSRFLFLILVLCYGYVGFHRTIGFKEILCVWLYRYTLISVDVMSSNKELRLIIADEDRISSLPDHILHCILRGLEAKNAAQTCVLSKRWRYVWTKLHTLKFRYPNYQLSPPLENNLNIKTASFTESVRHFLSHRDSSTNIHAIQFVAPYCFKAKYLNDIICYAHNIKRLSMKSFYTQEPVAAIKQSLKRFKSIKSLGFKPIRLSHYLSGCQSLTMLKLDSFNFVLSLPKSLSLPALQVVHLEWFRLFKINQDTLSSCPSLRVWICVIALLLKISSFSTFAPPSLSTYQSCICTSQVKILHLTARLWLMLRASLVLSLKGWHHWIFSWENFPL